MRAYRWDLLILFLASIFFFVSSGVLSINMPWIFNSPDENANAVFAKLVQSKNYLTFVEPINYLAQGIVHPRSVIAVRSFLTPVSFLGLPILYGFLAKVTGAMAMRFFTPLLAIAAIFAWRRLVEHLFKSRTIALLSSLFVFFHPGFWYYSGQSLMHNVPFVCFLILSAYLFFVKPIKKDFISMFLSGLCLALAIAFRTVEVIWIAPIVLILGVRFYKNILKKDLIGFIIGLFVILVPLLFVNNALYGNPFTVGYTYHEPSSAVVLIQNPDQAFPLLSYIKSILKNSWNYSVTLFPWLSFGSFIGLLAVLGSKKKISALSPTMKWYAGITVLVTLFLWIFYGSWNFNDNPDPTLITIGTSYIRYWLPIFVLISPYLAFAIVWLVDRMHHVFSRRLVLVGLTLLLIGLSVQPVFFAEDGLLSARSAMLSFVEKQAKIFSLTEKDAVIVVDRADKYLWPERRVVVPLRSDSTFEALPLLLKEGPLYYFGITFPESDLTDLNSVQLPPFGLQIEFVETMNEESLYHFYAMDL